MLPISESRQALLRLFQKRPVVALDTLLRTLRTRSRMSVFRRLSAIGYLSSYTHAGRFYTLKDIPQFDASGLWHHQRVSFSQDGSLKSTVQRLVHHCEAGKTHSELELALRVRVHNTLLDLVEHKAIGRVELPSCFLYVSAKPRHAKAQIARRLKEIETEVAKREAMPATSVVIAVLLEIIHGAKIEIEPALIAARLATRGVAVTAAQVETILEQHGLKKTVEPPSPRSRH